MDFNQYQEAAKLFACYEQECYPFIGLAEEVGEFLSFAAKMARGDDLFTRYESEEQLKEAALKEAGDVLWMLSNCLDEHGLSLQEAAELNIKKLIDRKQRGVIRGHGDDR
jgi:NTP pyrophosphatase (non-canonical NTP hydrolase)